MTASNHSRDRSATEVETPRDNSFIDEKPARDVAGVVEETSNDAVETTTDTGTDTPVYPSGFKLAIIIGSLCMAIFLVALDQTIVAPALGAITAEYKSVKDIVSLLRPRQ